ncbi:MAG: DNA/RNA helicase, partial [Streptococcaceae bacterium]|nr:DNA/RNA helicase [Streptococcaceae bacterium]
VSSIDPQRLEKVEAMRKQKIQCLITTTILERGVTFADVSVIVLGANHHVYTKSSLVQISGRVGRKLSRPTGRLIYLHDGKTKAMIQAKKQIQEMNRLAKKLNLIDEE